MKTALRCIFTLLMLCLSVQTLSAQSGNPALPGFDAAGSDEKAVKIADEVMNALGGKANWDNTRHVTWRFFGKRLHVWDKWTGDFRLETEDEVVLMNLNTKKGRAWKNKEEITHADSLAKKLARAVRIWNNDSYWMFMPYKLKDSGVTLTYQGDGKMEDGRDADVLQLTFKSVGDTPQNKYLVYVDKKSRLVEQWDFYADAGDDEPRFKNPWVNWEKHGTILLSEDRGRGKHSDIAVYETLPETVYTDPAPATLQ